MCSIGVETRKICQLCGKKFYAPNNYKDVLIQLYGNDYMKLPPVEKQVSHHHFIAYRK